MTVPPVSQPPTRKPEPTEVRTARNRVTNAANALALVWDDDKGRPAAQAKLDKARTALNGALIRAGLPPTH